MTQPVQRFQPDTSHQLSPRSTVYADRVGAFVDAVLRGLDRIFGGLTRPALVPVPVRIPHSGERRRA